MNTTEFEQKLIELSACGDAREFCKGKTLSEAWAQCPRGDWMLWLYKKLFPDNLKELTFAKGYCAATVKHLMKDKRSIAAVDAAIAFGNGEITREQLDEARRAAADAYAAADADADAAAADAYAAADADAAAAAADAYAAADADADAAAADAYAAAAADAAAAAADAYAAADADAYAAADAAAAAAADAADAKKQNQMETAEICRKYLKIDSLIVKP